MQLTRRQTVATLIVSAAAVAGLLAVSKAPSIWDSWRPATCMPDHCFCEKVRSQLVRQPANAASGVAFLGAAVLMVLVTFAGPRSVATPDVVGFRRTYPGLLAASTALVGIATAFYHASLTFWGQTADVFGMYLVATLIVLFSTGRLAKWSGATAVVVYIMTNAVLLSVLVAFPQARRYVFAFLVVLDVVLEVAARRAGSAPGNPRYFAAAIALLGGGFAIWALDITHLLCNPESALQGHAVWHVAGAMAAWMLFLYTASVSTVRFDRGRGPRTT